MAESNSDISLASRLCLSCGLCCDGTLYPEAIIRDDEVEDVRQIGLKTSRNAQGRSTFVFACHYLENACCTRYDEWRPSVCGAYFCHVQRRTRDGELTEAQAFATIDMARQLVLEVKALMPEGMPIAEARPHFTHLAAARPDITPEQAKFMVKLFVLERFLDQEFRKDNQNIPVVAPAATSA